MHTHVVIFAIREFPLQNGDAELFTIIHSVSTRSNDVNTMAKTNQRRFGGHNHQRTEQTRRLEEHISGLCTGDVWVHFVVSNSDRLDCDPLLKLMYTANKTSQGTAH